MQEKQLTSLSGFTFTQFLRLLQFGVYFLLNVAQNTEKLSDSVFPCAVCCVNI
jgi:hypothetical protein